MSNCVNRSSIYHPDYKQSSIYSCGQLPNYIPNRAILDVLNSKQDLPLYNMPRRPNRHIRFLNHDRRNPCKTDGVCASLAYRGSQSMRDECDPCVPKLRPLLICKDCGCTYRELAGSKTNPREMRFLDMVGSACGNSPDMLFSVNLDQVGEELCDPIMEDCPCQNCCRRRRAPQNHPPDCPCNLCVRKYAKCLNAEYYKWVRENGGSELDEGNCCQDRNGNYGQNAQVSCTASFGGKPVSCHCCVVFGNDGASISIPKQTTCNLGCSKSRRCWDMTPKKKVRLPDDGCCCPPKKQVCNCCYCQVAARHLRSLHGANCCCQKCILFRRKEERKYPRPCIQYPKLRQARCRRPVPCINSNSTCPRRGLCHGPLCTCSDNDKAQAAGTPLWCREEDRKCPCHRFVPHNWATKAPCDRRMCSSSPSKSRSRSRCRAQENVGCPDSQHSCPCRGREIDQTFRQSKTVIQVREEMPPPPPAKSLPPESEATSFSSSMTSTSRSQEPSKSALKKPPRTRADSPPSRPQSPNPKSPPQSPPPARPQSPPPKYPESPQSPPQSPKPMSPQSPPQSPQSPPQSPKPMSPQSPQSHPQSPKPIPPQSPTQSPTENVQSARQTTTITAEKKTNVDGKGTETTSKIPVIITPQKQSKPAEPEPETHYKSRNPVMLKPEPKGYDPSKPSANDATGSRLQTHSLHSYLKKDEAAYGGSSKEPQKK